MSILKSNIDYCRSTGSYQKNKNGTTPDFLMDKFYYIISEIAVVNRPIDAINSPYREINFRSEVVAIKFCVNVLYKERNFVIFCQVLFPPNFPLVPPIYSIINKDENKYAANKMFILNPLPDRSYEVKLPRSGQWANSLYPDVLFQDFQKILNENFPFHQVDNPPKINFPQFYDPRYNNPNTSFPFVSNSQTINPNADVPLSPAFGQNPSSGTHFSNPGFGATPFSTPYGGGPMNNPYGQQNSNPYSQPSFGNIYNNPGNYQPPNNFNPMPNINTANSNPNMNRPSAEIPTSSGRPFRNIRAIQSGVENLQRELQKDLTNISSYQESLLSKKRKEETFAQKSKQNLANLNQINHKLSQKQSELQHTFNEFKSKEMNDELLSKLVRFKDPHEKELLGLQTREAALNDTAAFIEEAFMEKEKSNMEKTLKQLEKVWKASFDCILIEKKLSNELNVSKF